MKRALIVAYSYAHAELVARTLGYRNRKDWTYVTGADKLHGRSPEYSTIVVYETAADDDSDSMTDIFREVNYMEKHRGFTVNYMHEGQLRP